LGVVICGAVGYVLIEDVDGLDAAYETILVISTVGLGEAWGFSAAGKVWTIIVASIGVATVLVAFSSLQAMVTGGELRRVMGRRKVESRMSSMSGHYVVCGFGRMGSMVAEALSKRETQVVVIDNEPELFIDFDDRKFIHVLGDASDESVLLEAGVDRAEGLVAALTKDSDNVYIALTARALNEKLFIVARAEQPATESKLIRAGANRVICPHIIGAQRIANLIARPSVVEFVDVAAEGLELEIDEFSLEAGSSLIGVSLGESGLRDKTGSMVVAIKHPEGKMIMAPGVDVVFKEGDTLIMIGPSGMAASVMQLI
jgi:voltage-gated potassium channel